MNYEQQLEANRNTWLKAIKNGNSKALELLYRAYRKEFIQWICRNTSCDVETATDVFQEAVLAFYKNVKSGKLQSLNSSIKTYVFAIGKRVYYSIDRKNQISTRSLEEVELSIENLMIPSKEPSLLNERQQLISKLLSKMRYPCKDILMLFYYRGYSLKEIVGTLEYKSVNVIKVLKVRCMKTLRKMVYAKT